MQKVYLEIDAKTDALKAKLNTSSGDVKEWAVQAEKSGKKAAKGFDEATKSSDRLGSSLTSVKGILASAFTAAAVVAAGENIIRTADAVAEMEGRLKVATRTTAEYNAAQTEVVNISKRSATQIGETVNLYARLSVALRETELAQRDVFRITETVNKAFTVSGATTVEAANAIRQLSQGMASGVLRGEEYNAITEQGDRIVQALADSLNKTRGELREMANDGKLSAEVVTKALLEQSGAIDAEYKQFPVTVARSITLMSNAWTEYITNSETAREASENVAQSIVFLSENLETLIDGVLLATQVIVAFYGAKGLKALSAAFIASSAASKTATTGAYSYAAAMGVAKTSTTAFGTAFKTVSRFVKTNALGIAVFGGIELIQYLTNLTDKVKELPPEVRDVNTAFETGINTDSLELANSKVEKLTQNLAELRAEQQRLEDVPISAQLAKTGDVGYGAQVRAELKNIRTEAEATQAALNKVFAANLIDSTLGAWIRAAEEHKAALEAQKQAVEATNSSIEKWITNQEKQVQKLTNANQAFGQSETVIAKLEAAQLKATTTNKKYHAEIDKVTEAKVRQIEISEQLKEAEDALNEATRAALDLANQYVQDTDPVGAAEELRAKRLEQIEVALKAGTITQKQYSDALKGANKLVTDAEQGLKKYEDKIRSADDVLEDLGITSNKTDADILLLKDALNQANAAMDTEAAEKYTQALKMLGEGARSASTMANFDIGVGVGGDVLSGLFNGNNAADSFVDSLSGVFDSALSGFQTAFSSAFAGGAGVGGSFSAGFAAVPVAGWIAAGIALSDGFFKDGWRVTDGDFGDFDNLNGINSPELAITLQVHQLVAATSNMLGISERWNNILDAGGSILTRAFGRKAPELEQSGFNATVGGAGVTGETFANILREGGWFRSDRRYTETEALTTEIVDQFTQLAESVGEIVADITRDLRTDYAGFVEGSFNQTYDKDGELESESSTFFGVTRDEDYTAFVARLTAENIIAALGAATGQIETIVESALDFGGEPGLEGLGRGLTVTRTIMVSELHQIAEAYRGNAETLLEFATFARTAVTDIIEGDGLLTTITETTAKVEELRRGQESLVEAYVRIKNSVLLTEQATTSMGVTLDLTRGEFIDFSTQLVEAAGGLEQAAALWENYFSRFYSAQELSDLELGRAQETSNSALTDIGLDPTTTMGEFREAFESVFAELSPEDVATWLEAGSALANYTDLVRVQVDAQLEANAALAESVQDINNDVLGLLRTGFQNTLASIEAQERETIATLNELAIAAGRAEVSEETLGRVHLRTALQTQQAIDQLRASAESLVNQLYGDELDQRIAELEAVQTNGVTSVGNAAENTYERQLALIRRIRDVIDSTLIDERLSPLTRTEQLNEGVGQFQELIALANAGDVEAQAQLPALYQELLGIGRDVFASGQGYTDLYAQLTGLLETVTPTGSPSEPQTVISVPSPELEALYRERDARNAEEIAAERLALAAELGSNLVDLSAALNQPLLQIAEDLGINMSSLVNDLGVNLDDITVETVGSLANVATSLGLSLTTLASSLGQEVGAELGTLANAQSLMNDALEARINVLPTGFRDSLTPLLRAVETAADGTERDAALLALESATADLPIEQRNALAPFFDNIDPVSELQEQIYIANRMETAAELRRLLLLRQANTLDRVANNLQAQNNSQGINSYAVGSTYIPYDQVAQIHKGEVIMTAQEAAIMRKYFGSGGSTATRSGGNDTLMRELINAVKTGASQTNKNLEQLKGDKQPVKNYSGKLNSVNISPIKKPVGEYI